MRRGGRLNIVLNWFKELRELVPIGAVIAGLCPKLCPRGTNSRQRTPTPAKNRLI